MYRLGAWAVKTHLEPFVKLDIYDFQKYNSDKVVFTTTRTFITGPLTCQHSFTALNLILYVILYCFFFKRAPKIVINFRHCRT